MRSLPLFLSIALGFSACGDKSRESIASYDDCLLSHLQGAQTQLAVQLIEQACAEKFPIKYDFEKLARLNGQKNWAEVAQSEQYRALNESDKEEAKKQYWSTVLQPHIRLQYVNRERERFFAKQ